MKKNLIILLVTLLLIIICAELIFKFFFPQNLSSPMRINGKFNLSLNNKNNKAKHIFRERTKIYSYGEYHNREYGFDKNKKKILVLGDSFTFGWLLNDKDTFIYKLNYELNDYFIVNSSTPGWGTSDFLRYLTDFCETIKPSYTLIFVNYLDHERAINSKLYSINQNDELIEGQNKIHKITLITENNIYKFLIENFHFINFLRKKYTQIYMFSKRTKIISDKNFDKKKDNKNIINNDFENKKKNIKEDSNYFNLYKKLYLKIKEVSQKCNSNLILINLAWEDYNKTPRLFFIRDNKNFFKENSIEFIDLNLEMKIIRNNKKEYEISSGGHPNEKANQYIFEIIKKKINF